MRPIWNIAKGLIRAFTGIIPFLLEFPEDVYTLAFYMFFVLMFTVPGLRTVYRNIRRLHGFSGH
jgi:hypothetical protein